MVITSCKALRKESENDFKRIVPTDNKVKLQHGCCLVSGWWTFWACGWGDKGELVEGQRDLAKSGGVHMFICGEGDVDTL